jgi:hypothetical protein
MNLNFFNKDCSEPARNNDSFGICDNHDNRKAYTDIVNPDRWIAVVKNDGNLDVTFTAIDNCNIVFQEGKKDKESTCDGALTFGDSLF